MRGGKCAVDAQKDEVWDLKKLKRRFIKRFAKAQKEINQNIIKAQK